MARRWPVQGGLATCTGKAEHGGLGRVLAGFGLGVGALWALVGEVTPVGIVQRAEGEERGVRAASSFSFHVSRPGSGQGRLGLNNGGLHEHGYRAKANGNSVGHSSLDLSWISPTKCSVKCPQEFKIQIFEKFHFGLSTY
jgi:hypothetical protein